MLFNIVTIFPEFFDSVLQCGLLGKAVAQGMVRVKLINPRDYTHDRHRSVDDRPYGGGPGMVMTLPPLAAALRGLDAPGRMVFLCPTGPVLDHQMAAGLAKEDVLTLICGRYEGVDARLDHLFPLSKVSVGDAVLNGGETAALHVLEVVSRLLPGFMGHAGSPDADSFACGVLDHPHYSRPEDFEGHQVPEVLLSGDHARVAEWRREASLSETLEHKPELLQDAPLDVSDVSTLRCLHASRAKISRNCYLALAHAPVLDKHGRIGTVSLTNLDIHDIGRVSRTYGMGGYFVCTPLEDQQRLAQRLRDHWIIGSGAGFNPDRAQALERVHIVDSLDSAVHRLRELSGSEPILVGTSAKGLGTISLAHVRALLKTRPVLLVLGTGHGLAPEVLDRCAGVLRPVRFYSGYNHLSVRSAAAILVDRLLGDAH